IAPGPRREPMRTAWVPQSNGTPRIAALLPLGSREKGTPIKLGGGAKMAGSSIELLDGMRAPGIFLGYPPRSQRHPLAMDDALAMQRVDAAGYDDGGASPRQGVRQR